MCFIGAENNSSILLLINTLNDKNSRIVSLKKDRQVKFREILKEILIVSRKASINMYRSNFSLFVFSNLFSFHHNLSSISKCNFIGVFSIFESK